MLTQGPTTAGTASASPPAHAPPASDSSALRFERDAALDFNSESSVDDPTPAAALALPAHGWAGFGLLCFLCLLAACTLVRPRLIRRIQGRHPRRTVRADSASVHAPLAAAAPAATRAVVPPGQLLA